MSDAGPENFPDDPGPSTPYGQSFAAGLLLIGFSLLALWAMRNLDGGTLRSIGPGGFPRAVAILIAVLGGVIAVIGWRKGSPPVEAIRPRPVIVVLLSIAVFAATIRPWTVGGLSIPGLGLVGAGPLTVMISGLADKDCRWLELGILATLLTAFCMVLFGDLLGLPIPVMPVALLGYFPGWGQRSVLRLLAIILVLIGGGLYLVLRWRMRA